MAAKLRVPDDCSATGSAEISIDITGGIAPYKDFKIEFGKNSKGEILLADEITPDTCRLWDKETGEKLDKDRFRRDLGNIEEAYIEVVKRLTEKK